MLIGVVHLSIEFSFCSFVRGLIEFELILSRLNIMSNFLKSIQPALNEIVFDLTGLAVSQFHIYHSVIIYTTVFS